jgi:hypothetical protein
VTDLDLATQTMFAELLQRSLDAEFDIRGTFRRKKSKGRFYWHHQLRVGDKVVSRYVGPVTDRSITDRVNRFAQIKSDFKRRQEMVRALIAAGLPTPDATSGAVKSLSRNLIKPSPIGSYSIHTRKQRSSIYAIKIKIVQD